MYKLQYTTRQAFISKARRFTAIEMESILSFKIIVSTHFAIDSAFKYFFIYKSCLLKKSFPFLNPSAVTYTFLKLTLLLINSLDRLWLC